MIKGVHTIAQFKAMQFIEKHFILESVKCDLVDADTVKVTDKRGKSITVAYVGGVIMTS